jgi:hypothetical protein
MSRFVSLQRLTLASLATIGIIAACRAAQPGEAPPLAPRPDPIQPSANPVPGAPDPIDPGVPGPNVPSPGPDAGIPGVPSEPVTSTRPEFRSARVDPAQLVDAGTGADDAATLDDAGTAPVDAQDLPPVPDAGVPLDAPGGPLR